MTEKALLVRQQCRKSTNPNAHPTPVYHSGETLRGVGSPDLPQTSIIKQKIKETSPTLIIIYQPYCMFIFSYNCLKKAVLNCCILANSASPTPPRQLNIAVMNLKFLSVCQKARTESSAHNCTIGSHIQKNLREYTHTPTT